MLDLDTGVIGGSNALPQSDAIPIAAFVAIALYNVLELNFIILVAFKKRHGLYFWSFCVATWGIVPCAVGFLLKGIGATKSVVMLYVTMILVGWACMVTGQSLVLYSRLHLIDRNVQRLRAVLAMIVTNAIVLHIPVSVLLYGANTSQGASFIPTYSVYEKVQVCIFFVQELIISGLYILATIKYFRQTTTHAKSTKRNMLWHLLFVNVVVILLDITILGLEFSGHHELQTSYKALVYSVKLKLEFNVLNKLATLTRTQTSAFVSVDGYQDTSEDHIFDGSRQIQTCLDSRGYCLDPMDGTICSRQKKHNQAASLVEPEPAYSAYVRSGEPPRAERVDAPPNDGIVVMTTTSIDVRQQDEVDRQWRSMVRIPSETEAEPPSIEAAIVHPGDVS